MSFYSINHQPCRSAKPFFYGVSASKLPIYQYNTLLEGSLRSSVESEQLPDTQLVLVLILGTSHHQADACHLASVYLGFRSIWNTHFCLRLQPHLYPSLVATSLGRDVRPNSDISQRMSSPTPPSETRNYCWIKVGDSQRWTHIENPTRLNVIDPDWV